MLSQMPQGNKKVKESLGEVKDPLMDILNSLMLVRQHRINRTSPGSSKGKEIISSPDFSDLADKEFINSLPFLHKFITDKGYGILVADEQKFSVLKRLNDLLGRDLEQPASAYMIIQMGVRDVESLERHNPRGIRNAATGDTAYILTYTREAIHYWRRKDRERALYYLGGALKAVQDIVIKKTAPDMGMLRRFIAKMSARTDHEHSGLKCRQFHLQRPRQEQDLRPPCGDLRDIRHTKKQVYSLGSRVNSFSLIESYIGKISINEWLVLFKKRYTTSTNSTKHRFCSGRFCQQRYISVVQEASHATAAFLVAFFKEVELI